MKKIIFLILFLLFYPTLVFADDYTIKTHVKLENGTLDGNEFTFVLKDGSGKIIQTKSNDKNGDIIFDPIKYNKDMYEYTSWISDGKEVHDDFGLKIYTIEEVSGNNIKYQKSRKIWVKAVLFPDGSSKLYYLEDPDIDGLLKNVVKYEANPYHASNDELKGEAYSKINLSTGEATIFRDEPGKYTTGEKDGYYYTSDIEHTNVGYNTFYFYRDKIKSIVMENSIKPDSCNGIFEVMPNLETVDLSKLDTSNCDSFEYMFYECYSLKSIDMTTLDFSNVKNFSYLCDCCYSAEEIKIPHDWNLTGLSRDKYYDMFNCTYNLKFMDLSFLGTIDYKREYINVFNQSGLRVIDLSSVDVNVNYSDIYELWESLFDYNKQAYYVNLTTVHNDLNNPTWIDLDVQSDSLRVVDVGENFYGGSDMGLIPYSWPNYNKLSYNIDHNVFDPVLADSSYSYNKNYAPSGRHLYIVDSEVTLIKTLKNSISKSKTIYINDKFNLLSIDDNEKIEWINENPNIVNIVNNEVIPLKLGVASLSGITDSNIYNLTITVKELTNQSDDDSKNEQVSNPKTGIYDYVIEETFLICFLFFIYNRIKKKTLFKKY